MMEPGGVQQNLVVDHAAVEALRGRFAPELAQRAVRKARPRHPKVTDLKPLTMRAITKARFLLSAKYHSLEHILPPLVLEELMISPETGAMRSDPDCLRLLLSPLSSHCVMDTPFAMPDHRQPCPRSVRVRKEMESTRLKQNLDKFANVVLNTAKDRIRILQVGEVSKSYWRANSRYKNWSVDVSVLRDFLHRLLEGLTELHELLVIHWPGVVNHETFQILGKRHKNLKSLLVYFPEYEEYGLYMTQKDLLPLVSQCSKMEELLVTGTFDSVQTMMPLLTKLTTLYTRDPNTVGFGVYTYAMQDPLPPPLVIVDTSVEFDYKCNLQDRQLVTRVFSVIPNVTDVELSVFYEETAMGLIEVNNPIIALVLKFRGAIHLDTQQRLMEKFSRSLTRLEIRAVMGDTCDLGAIAQYCLTLEYLIILAEIIIGENFMFHEEQLTKLTTCCLEHCPENQPFFRLPDDLARQMFSAPPLNQMIVGNVEVSGQVMRDICGPVETGGEVLGSLESLSLKRIRGLTMEDVISLICASPRLTSLNLTRGGSLSERDVAMIQSFCQNTTSLQRDINVCVRTPSLYTQNLPD